MRPLAPNAETGYLESYDASGRAFTSVKKVRALQIAEDFCKRHEYPNVASLCDAVNTSLTMFYYHMRHDEKFAEDWNEIRLRTEAWLIEALSVKARSANGVVANLALLRDCNPARWNPEVRLNHSNNSDRSKEISSRLSGYTDTYIVDNPQITSTQDQQADKST